MFKGLCFGTLRIIPVVYALMRITQTIEIHYSSALESTTEFENQLRTLCGATKFENSSRNYTEFENSLRSHELEESMLASCKWTSQCWQGDVNLQDEENSVYL